MTIERLINPTLVENLQTIFREGLIPGGIFGTITSISDEEHIGRIKCRIDVFDENLEIPSDTDYMVWVLEETVLNSVPGGTHRDIKVGTTGVFLPILGDPKQLVLLGCIANRVDRPHPELDRAKEKTGSVTLGEVFDIKDDSDQSRIQAYPHGVTGLVSKEGDWQWETLNKGRILLEQNANVVLDNPKGSTNIDPDGLITTQNFTGVSQQLFTDGKMDLKTPFGSKVFLHEGDTKITGPGSKLAGLSRLAGFAAQGSLGGALTQLNLVQGLTQDAGISPLNDILKSVDATKFIDDTLGKTWQQATDIFDEISNLDIKEFVNTNIPQVEEMVGSFPELERIVDGAITQVQGRLDNATQVATNIKEQIDGFFEQKQLGVFSKDQLKAEFGQLPLIVQEKLVETTTLGEHRIKGTDDLLRSIFTAVPSPDLLGVADRNLLYQRVRSLWQDGKTEPFLSDDLLKIAFDIPNPVETLKHHLQGVIKRKQQQLAKIFEGNATKALATVEQQKRDRDNLELEEFFDLPFGSRDGWFWNWSNDLITEAKAQVDFPELKLQPDSGLQLFNSFRSRLGTTPVYWNSNTFADAVYEPGNHGWSTWQSPSVEVIRDRLEGLSYSPLKLSESILDEIIPRGTFAISTARHYQISKTADMIQDLFDSAPTLKVMPPQSQDLFLRKVKRYWGDRRTVNKISLEAVIAASESPTPVSYLLAHVQKETAQEARAKLEPVKYHLDQNHQIRSLLEGIESRNIAKVTTAAKAIDAATGTPTFTGEELFGLSNPDNTTTPISLGDLEKLDLSDFPLSDLFSGIGGTYVDPDHIDADKFLDLLVRDDTVVNLPGIGEVLLKNFLRQFNLGEINLSALAGETLGAINLENITIGNIFQQLNLGAIAELDLGRIQLKDFLNVPGLRNVNVKQFFETITGDTFKNLRIRDILPDSPIEDYLGDVVLEQFEHFDPVDLTPLRFADAAGIEGETIRVNLDELRLAEEQVQLDLEKTQELFKNHIPPLTETFKEALEQIIEPVNSFLDSVNDTQEGTVIDLTGETALVETPGQAKLWLEGAYGEMKSPGGAKVFVDGAYGELSNQLGAKVFVDGVIGEIQSLGGSIFANALKVGVKSAFGSFGFGGFGGGLFSLGSIAMRVAQSQGWGVGLRLSPLRGVSLSSFGNNFFGEDDDPDTWRGVRAEVNVDRDSVHITPWDNSHALDITPAGIFADGWRIRGYDDEISYIYGRLRYYDNYFASLTSPTSPEE